MKQLSQHHAEAARLDPLDENLLGNLACVSAIALEHCGDCIDYHVGFVARRLAKESGSAAGFGGTFLEMAAGYLRTHAGRTGPVDVLVTGAADSGVAAVAVKAAAEAGAEVLSRLRLTVTDLCRTPLELTRRYAEQVGIEIDVAALDLTAPEKDFQADLILVDCVLRHIPYEHHTPILRRIASWLKPNGAILFFQPVGPKDMASQLRQRLGEEEALERVLETLPLSEPLPDLMERLRRERTVKHHIAEYETQDAVDRLYTEAGLTVVERRSKTRRFGNEGMRVISLLAKA
jgi:hypothetical protein